MHSKFYIWVDSIDGEDLYYGFSAPTDAYVWEGGNLAEPLGIVGTVGGLPPEGGKVTTVGTYADYADIVRVRLRLTNGKSITRLCDGRQVSQLLATATGLEYKNTEVVEARIVRKRIRR